MGETRSIRILLICGSLRAGSTNEAVLRTAQASAPERVAAIVYDRMGDLPLPTPIGRLVADRMANIEEAMPTLVEVQQHLARVPDTLEQLNASIEQLRSCSSA